MSKLSQQLQLQGLLAKEGSCPEEGGRERILDHLNIRGERRAQQCWCLALKIAAVQFLNSCNFQLKAAAVQHSKCCSFGELGVPKVINDEVTMAQAIVLSDAVDNVGALLILCWRASEHLNPYVLISIVDVAKYMHLLSQVFFEKGKQGGQSEEYELSCQRGSISDVGEED